MQINLISVGDRQPWRESFEEERRTEGKKFDEKVRQSKNALGIASDSPWMKFQ